MAVINGRPDKILSLGGLVLIIALQFQSCLALNSTELAQAVGTKSFLDSIFSRYGENNGSYITAMKFKALMVHLSIGGVFLENLDKNCLYKGVHTGMQTQQTSTDGMSIQAGSTATKSGQNSVLTRQRRSDDHGKQVPTKENPQHNQHLKKHYAQCLSRHSIFDQHKLNENGSVTRETFLRLCPALVSQISGGFCMHKHNCSIPWYAKTKVSTKMVWVYGFVAITAVSFASLAIIAVIPCLERGFYQRVMGYLVALAVGTLAGDALLHLIPHAFESLLGGTKDAHKKNIWKSCFILLGMYSFFLVEQLMKIKTFFKKKKQKGMTKKSSIKSSGPDAKDNDAVEYKRACSKESEEKKPEEDSSGISLQENRPSSPGACSNTELILLPPGDDRTDHYDHDPHDHLQKHDHHSVPHDLEHGHGHSHGTINKDTSIASVAWMVIVGDGFHNFSDGLAIGAAFAASYTSGISTTIAVFCHELPHELGDFAVLIKSGMSIKQAIFYNLVSAVLSYVGLVIGIIVGNYSADGKQYALALTAGLFLYVALANMLPELTSSIDDDEGDLWSFIAPHLGILSGIAIMLLISIYEDKF